MLVIKVTALLLAFGFCRGNRDSYLACINQGNQQGANQNNYQTFTEAALAPKHYCRELRRNDCLFYHEASEKCSCCCQELINSNADSLPWEKGSPQANPNNYPNSYNPAECFHGDDLVSTDRGTMKMSELRANPDVKVLSRNRQNQLEYSPIVYWTHAVDNLEGTFFAFTTENDKVLHISNLHLIYETDCNGQSRTVFAKRVSVGKCLLVNVDGELKESKVIKRETMKKVGIFAPITTNGNIIVNDVLASCYTNYENEGLQQIMYSCLIKANRLMNRFAPTWMLNAFFGSTFSDMGDVPLFLGSFKDLVRTFVHS